MRRQEEAIFLFPNHMVSIIRTASDLIYKIRSIKFQIDQDINTWIKKNSSE